MDKSLDFMVVLWSCSDARAVISGKTGKRAREVNKGGAMQQVIVALVLGIKRKGWVAPRGTRHLIPNWLRLIPSVSFDHSILMVPEFLGTLMNKGVSFRV